MFGVFRRGGGSVCRECAQSAYGHDTSANGPVCFQCFSMRRRMPAHSSSELPNLPQARLEIKISLECPFKVHTSDAVGNRLDSKKCQSHKKCRWGNHYRETEVISRTRAPWADGGPWSVGRVGGLASDCGRVGLRGGAGWIYRRFEDDSKFQPLRIYVPLLAHNSGLGGLASSERSETTIWNLQLIRHPCEPRPNLSRLLLW
jgi:hypothetical protein